MRRLFARLRSCEGTRFSANLDEHAQENEGSGTHHQQNGHQPSPIALTASTRSIGKSPDLAPIWGREMRQTATTLMTRSQVFYAKN